MGDYGYDYNLMTRQLNQLTSPTGGKLDLSYSGALLTGMAFSGEVTGSVAYSYDSDFRASEVSVNGVKPISYGYDNDSLLSRIGDLHFTRNSQKNWALDKATDWMADQTDKMVPGSKDYTKPILDSRSVKDNPKIIRTMKKSFDDAAVENKPKKLTGYTCKTG